ncbi:globin domain-containing protein [Spongisporangium articulatum]|uniref:nitric oxide dioxygenase n=1 Tax=Spongisporangium articulatum TaxID=3362603 RepID=A0ABW8AN79_9ACTN
MVDTDALQRSFGLVARHGDEVPLYFYSHLFLRYPQTRPMFPAAMSAQRDRLVGALVRVVSNVHQVQTVVPYLQQLARDHRKYGVTDDHYPMVGAALLATLEHFLGEEWTPELAADWTAAYGVIASVMTEASAEASGTAPAWYDAEVVDHESRGPGVAVLTVRPDRRVEYRAGQSLSVQTPAAPRIWRYFSPANAPRADDTLEFHVRAVDGGWVSPNLVARTGKGDILRLGAPVGEGLHVPSSQTARPVLMLAGGTGLAPLRAIVEELARQQDDAGPGHVPRPVGLFVGARTEQELYDLPYLRRLEAQLSWLDVVPVVARAAHLTSTARTGHVAEVALHAAVAAARASGSAEPPEIYVCGSDQMVAGCLEVLAQGGIDTREVRRELYGYERHTTIGTLDVPEEAPHQQQDPVESEARA